MAMTSPFEPPYEPYSFAAEQALSERELTIDELEASVKETPPRSTSFHRQTSTEPRSEPRALGDVMDESEKMLPPGSPSLRHTKGRLEDNMRSSSSGSHQGSTPSFSSQSPPNVARFLQEDSYADVLKHEPSSNGASHEVSAKDETANGASIPHESASHTKQDGESYADVLKHEPVGAQSVHDELPELPHADAQKDNVKAKHETGGESYADIVKHEPTSPALRPQTPPDSQEPQTTNGTQKDGGQNAGYPSPPSSVVRSTDNSQQEHHDDEKPGELFYENYESRSGSNLASIVLGNEYDLSLSQRENKDISSEPLEDRPQEKPKLVSGRRAGAGWQRSAVRWAPHNVPLQRRLQTFAVLAHSLSIAVLTAFFFFLCAIPIFWPILLPYLIYVLLSSASTDGKLAYRSERFRRSKFWSLFASYFPARLHRSVELEPTRKYIFGYHPHGIISHGGIAAFATEALGFGSLFPGITNTILTLDSNFRLPFYRDYLLRLGLASVSKKSCENLLTRGGINGEGMGRAITIVIGGARESLDAKPGTLRLVLAKRKGFVKLAVRTGADLVPVLAFGENDMYEQIDSDTHPWIHKGQMALKKFMGFTVPLFHARGVFNYDVGIMPYRRPINIVVGRPIRVQGSGSSRPDPAYVDDLHEQYTTELLRLWNDWKDTFAPDRKEELQIVE